MSCNSNIELYICVTHRPLINQELKSFNLHTSPWLSSASHTVLLYILMNNMAPCGLRFLIPKIYRLLSSQMHWSQTGRSFEKIPFVHTFTVWSHCVLSGVLGYWNQAVCSLDSCIMIPLCSFKTSCSSYKIQMCHLKILILCILLLFLSVAYIFGPPGSGPVSTRYGSGSKSFYHQAKVVRKTSLRLFIFEKWCNCSFKK
jgi:hypothetical protein